MWSFIKQNGKIDSFSTQKNTTLVLSILGCLGWSIQLLGTFMFVYGVYLQELVIIGPFLYSFGSLFWTIRIWIYISRPDLEEGKPCIKKNEDPQSNGLSEISQSAN